MIPYLADYGSEGGQYRIVALNSARRAVLSCRAL